MRLPNSILNLLTVDTNAYAPGDVVGGKLTFDLSAFRDVDQLMLSSLVLSDKSDQASTYYLILFATDPSNTTFTDNGALNIHDSDVQKIFAILPIAVELDVGGARVRTLDPTYTAAIPIPLAGTDTSNKIYGCLALLTGTPTFAAADLALRMNFSFTR